MASVKWIKIVTDIFDDEKILLIESMSGADSIIVIWFKLLCLAGKQNNGGVFTMGDQIPYTEDMLATIFHRKKSVVKQALKVFQEFGMIEVVDRVITIPNWKKHQNLDAYEKRKARDREYQKQRYQTRYKKISAENSADISADVSPALASLDKEEEKEEDKEKDKRERKRESANPASAASAPPPAPAVFSIPLNDGTTYGVTQEAIDEYAVLYPAVDVPQELRKMIGWANANPQKRKTKGGIKRHIASWLAREQDKGGAKVNNAYRYAPTNPALNYDQRPHDESDYDSLFLDLSKIIAENEN